MTTAVARSAWADKAQAFELAHWRGKDEATARELYGAEALDRSRLILERRGFRREQFRGQEVLDVGAGPTGRLSWLAGARITALDPLYQEPRFCFGLCSCGNSCGNRIAAIRACWGIP